ncbi:MULTISPECIES: DoxX family protein [Methylomonas]|uniref:DoxX family protein n=1 Tax=Methylomonas TaxID=416 RepID=UPI001E63826E|nr:DoxX family protein [Methylomonas rhizoryzae]
MNSRSMAGIVRPAPRPGAFVFRLGKGLDGLAPLGNLLLRAWVAYAFWVSGLTKIRNWDSTLYLFEYEYKVPLLPPDVAAVLGTAVELLGPLLLSFGVCGRAAALLLFFFNVAAVISYPDLGPAGIEQHKIWGLMLLVCVLQGPGAWSLDAWVCKRFLPER